MSQEKVNTFKLGLFVTVAVVLFGVAVYYIGNEQNLFQPTFRLNAVFKDAEGLKPGNNVRYAGIDAGTVQKIVITSDSTLRVEMLLHREMQAYIKKDAIAGIGSDGLVGNKLVNISPNPGNGTAELVDDQDVIPSYSRLATADMLDVLGKTNENIALFSLQLLRISEKINKGSGTMHLLLEDAALADDLRQSMANLKYTTQSMQAVGEDLRQALARLNGGDGLLHDLLYDTTVMEGIQSLSRDLKGLVTQQVDPLLTVLQQSAENINQSTTSLNSMLQDIQAGKGTLGVLLRDTSMENDLRISLTNIRQSAERFNENMEAMRHNFLFKAYFKKLEKQERQSLKQ